MLQSQDLIDKFAQYKNYNSDLFMNKHPTKTTQGLNNQSRKVCLNSNMYTNIVTTRCKTC